MTAHQNRQFENWLFDQKDYPEGIYDLATDLEEFPKPLRYPPVA